MNDFLRPIFHLKNVVIHYTRSVFEMSKLTLFLGLSLL